MTDRFKRAVALGAATVAVTAGTLLGAVGTASATPSHHHPLPDRGRHCHIIPGHWTQRWIPAHWEHHRLVRGHSVRVWLPGTRDCRR